MSASPWLRKLLLTLHITCSVGWFGAILAYIALNIPVLTAEDPQIVRGALLMMGPVAWYAIVPLAMGCLVSGIVLSLASPWGLFRHYWVVVSLASTVFATVILLMHMRDIGAKVALAANPDTGVSQMSGDLFHSVGGLVVLALPLVLNIYKPSGLTRYGWRRRARTAAVARPTS